MKGGIAFAVIPVKTGIQVLFVILNPFGFAQGGLREESRGQRIS